MLPDQRREQPNLPKVSVRSRRGCAKSAAVQFRCEVSFSYVGETASEFRPTSVFFERIDAYKLTNLRLRLSNADTTWNMDLYVDNVFDEVAIGRLLWSPFGFDLTLSAPPRTIWMGFSRKW